MNSLRSRTGRALAWDLFGSYGGQIVGFIISIFLARLLEPAEFGLVGMSLVFINILRVFVDMGFASALVQNKQNTSLTYSSIFYINILAGFLFAIIIFFSAPLIGAFYENENVTVLVRLFSITFIVSAFNIVQSTILRRNLDFKILTLRGLFSQILAGIVAVIFAFYGFGIYALVIQNILAAVINTIILWKVSEWYPKWEFSWKEVKKLTNFSAYVFASQSVNQIIVQSDTLIIGKLFSPATLGYFSRANSVSSLINKNAMSSITRVFFPVLSSIQDDEQRFREVYLRVINIVATISIFITGVFFLCGEELIIGLFGIKWEPSVFIFQILIIKGFTYPISAMIVNAFIAKGKSKENFKFGNIRKVVQLTPLFIAYFFGFQEFLYALVGASLMNWLLNNYFITRSLNISFGSQTKAVLPHLLFTVAIAGILYTLFPEERNYLLAIVKVILFVLSYIGYLYLTKAVLFKESLQYKTAIQNKIKQLLNIVQ